MSPAHPRSRGENPRKRKPTAYVTGSSPLTRGKHILGEMERQMARLIPAHAGKTDEAGKPVSADEAHPRSRGENIRQTVNGYGHTGSSPLTRGKRATVDREAVL